MPEDIVMTILNSHLNKVLRYDNIEPKQQRMKVNIPYWNPLQATEWLRDRMASSLGAPYFLYATLRDDLIRLEDLDSIMVKSPWNKEHPYTYSQTSHNKNNSQSQFFHVKSYDASQIESTLRLAQAGAVGSEYKAMDLTSGSKTAFPWHNSELTLEKLKAHTEANSDIKTALGFDGELSFEGISGQETKIGDLSSKVFSEVVTSRKFYELDGITSIAGYADEHKQESLYKLKIKSAALRAILLNNVYEITVPGQPYISGNLDIGIGSNILLDVATASQADGSIRAGDVDQNKSGKFLVYRTRHMFAEGNYNVKMDIVKLTDKTGEV